MSAFFHMGAAFLFFSAPVFTVKGFEQLIYTLKSALWGPSYKKIIASQLQLVPVSFWTLCFIRCFCRWSLCSFSILNVDFYCVLSPAGLESVRRLQRLSLDHNELISTKGLIDIYTLLHLSCSHNHLTSIEGLENNALLNTLDLRDNSLAEVEKKK